MNLFFLIYIAVISYITIPICKIVLQDKLDNDLIFLLSSNYILLFLLSFLSSTNIKLVFLLLASFSLMIVAFLLIRKIKSIFNYYQLLSLPYFCFIVYVFSSILMLI